MRKLFTLLALSFLMVGLTFGQTNYDELFDVEANWAGGSMGGYNAKTYTNDAVNPANDQFSTNNAVRETANVHSGDYAWRLKKEDDTYLMYESTETVDGVSFHAARWDNNPKPEVTLEYSEDSGTSWTTFFTFDGDDFSGDKVYKEFSALPGGSISPQAGETLQIRWRTTAGERMLYDNITITYQGGNPTAGSPVFDPAAGTYPAAQTVSITSSTYNSSIYYTTDGSTPDNTSTLYTAPISIATTTTLKAIAIKIGYDDSPVTTGEYIIVTPVSIADIATLRTQIADGTTFYTLTGEAILTFQQAYRNQKYIQDATAAILIDDAPNGSFNPGFITTTYTQYDGITGITATLSEYQGMLQISPIADPGAATSTGNTITPVVKTLDEINNNFDDLEAQLVQINGALFTDAGGSFANGNVYEVSDGSKGVFNFRTTFYNVDYIGTTIPYGADMVCLLNERSAGKYITARDAADMVPIPTPPSVPLGSGGILIAGLLLGAFVVVRKGKLF